MRHHIAKERNLFFLPTHLDALNPDGFTSFEENKINDWFASWTKANSKTLRTYLNIESMKIWNG